MIKYLKAVNKIGIFYKHMLGFLQKVCQQNNIDLSPSELITLLEIISEKDHENLTTKKVATNGKHMISSLMFSLNNLERKNFISIHGNGMDLNIQPQLSSEKFLEKIEMMVEKNITNSIENILIKMNRVLDENSNNEKIVNLFL